MDSASSKSEDKNNFVVLFSNESSIEDVDENIVSGAGSAVEKEPRDKEPLRKPRRDRKLLKTFEDHALSQSPMDDSLSAVQAMKGDDPAKRSTEMCTEVGPLQQLKFWRRLIAWRTAPWWNPSLFHNLREMGKVV